MRVRYWVVGVVVLVVLLWGANLFFAPTVATWLSTPVREGAGQLGDSFGAINAMFSGLGAFGIAIVLVSDRRRIRLSQRPFLVLEDITANVREARLQPAPEFELLLEASMANVTENIALDGSIEVSSRHQFQGDVMMSSAPLRGGDKVGMYIVLSVKGDRAQRVIQAFQEEKKVTIDVVLRARSLDESVWETVAKFDLTADASRYGVLRKIAEGDVSGSITEGLIGTTSDRLILTPKDLQGSWVQRELGPWRRRSERKGGTANGGASGR